MEENPGIEITPIAFVPSSVAKILRSAITLLSAYPQRIGNNGFDTIDCRWIVLDPLVFNGLIEAVQYYVNESMPLDSAINEGVRVYLSNYLSGGKSILNRENSKRRIFDVFGTLEDLPSKVSRLEDVYKLQ